MIFKSWSACGLRTDHRGRELCFELIRSEVIGMNDIGIQVVATIQLWQPVQATYGEVKLSLVMNHRALHLHLFTIFSFVKLF
jgi:hypothetical protein